jgi:hypothetical protein
MVVMEVLVDVTMEGGVRLFPINLHCCWFRIELCAAAPKGSVGVYRAVLQAHKPPQLRLL